MVYHRISHGSPVFSRGNTSDKRDILWQSTRERYIIILNHAITVPTQSMGLTPGVAHDGCNTFNYTPAVQHSDWLNFLWHDIKKGSKIV